jgi:hypothetical protein
MKREQVAAVEIDAEGKLYVTPAESEFQHIFLEAMEVSWDNQKSALHSPIPREWTYERWLQQIFAAARAQGTELQLHPETRWINVPDALRSQLEQPGTAA